MMSRKKRIFPLASATIIQWLFGKGGWGGGVERMAESCKVAEG